MRLYEVVYIFNADLDEDAVNEKLTALHALATAGDGAEVAAVDHWGTRQMAYPIQKSRSGYYVVAHLRASADSLPEYERALTLVLRQRIGGARSERRTEGGRYASL